MTTAVAGATSAPAAPANGAASNTQALAPGTTDAPKPPAAGQPSQAKPPEQPWRAKRKLVIAGKEVEREYDDRRLQILEHTASQQAEFQRIKAEFDARMQRLEQDPDGFLQESGIDVEAVLAARQQRLEAMKQMTPEQRRIQELEDTISKREAADKKRTDDEAKAKVDAEERAFVAGNTKLYGATMQLAGIKPGMPGVGSFLSNMATVRAMAHQNGEPDLTPQQLLAHTERYEQNMFRDMVSRRVADEGWRGRNNEGLQSLAKTLLSTLDGDALVDWVGPDFAKKVVKAIHARTFRSPTPIVQETPREAPTTQAAPNGKQRDEWDVLDSFGG